MAVCEICGCKTDSLDFVEGDINGIQKKMCSFCNKQLKSFGEKPNEAQLRWLDVVLSKAVPERSADTVTALSEISKKFNLQQKKVDQNLPEETAMPKQKPKNKGSVTVEEVDKDQLILELLGRVEKLEKTLIMMRRKQIIKSIIEIVVPIILGIVILIVLFSSGIFDTLLSLYNYM